jgi:PAS domain-containing protein
VIADADTGEIVEVNPFLLGLLSCTREDLVGRRFWEADPFLGTALDRQLLAEVDRQRTVRRKLALCHSKRAGRGSGAYWERLCGGRPEAHPLPGGPASIR